LLKSAKFWKRFAVLQPEPATGTADFYVHDGYSDHVSILSFIEHNWKLRPQSRRSHDRLPNPLAFDDDPPVNSPAIGDLTSLFQFLRRLRSSPERLTELKQFAHRAERADEERLARRRARRC
jgi:hypothetical protein